MESLIRLHATASAIVWNIEKCRKYQKLSYESVQIAKQAGSMEAEKSANESLQLYKKCENRFLERYQRILTKINNIAI